MLGITFVLALALSFGYYVGYDIGFEKAASSTNGEASVLQAK